MGAFAETDGENGVRPGTISEPPDVRSQGKSDDRARSGCDENGFAPGASFFDVTLAFKDGNFDSLCFGFGFAEGRANVAEEFHALGTNRLAADVTFFDGKLAHVPVARLGGVWIGSGLR